MTKYIKGYIGETEDCETFLKPPSVSYGWLRQGGQHTSRQGLILMGIHFTENEQRGRHSILESNRWYNTFQSDFPRMYALETQKNISVALKLSYDDLLCSFRRAPRAGAEELQYIQLMKIMEGITLFDSKDRWRWSLEGCDEFTVASVRNLLDANSLPVVSSKTRWIKVVPIKFNIHAWKVKLDILPTRLNISKRGMDMIDSMSLYGKRM
ncbi:hypothetical protein Tco_1568654 [Tanacetum coccineum]